jgi:hypothetical protein
VLCADEAVRDAIATVFRRFAELSSARQVMLSLRDDGLDLPRRRAGAASSGSWPVTAGSSAYWPTRVMRAHSPSAASAAPARQAGGHGPPGRSVRRPVSVSEWQVLITGHHPGYITWEEYLGNQQKLHANCPAPAGRGGKAAGCRRACCAAAAAAG